MRFQTCYQQVIRAIFDMATQEYAGTQDIENQKKKKNKILNS